ncbi:Uncharacterised protein [Vibrio cholerae]|nr:Uncharacterised protein [Vibrio cholerae]
MPSLELINREYSLRGRRVEFYPESLARHWPLLSGYAS